jgi:hypothetical protein
MQTGVCTTYPLPILHSAAPADRHLEGHGQCPDHMIILGVDHLIERLSSVKEHGFCIEEQCMARVRDDEAQKDRKDICRE